MKHLYRLLSFAVITLSTLPLCAQMVSYDDNSMLRHEISAHFAKPGAGAMPFDAQYAWGKTASDWAYGFGLSYTYWFNEHFGLTSGLHFTYVRFDETFEDITSSTRGTIVVTGSDGNPLRVNATMRVSTPYIEESQAIFMFELPVMASIQAKHIFGNFGFAFATPITTYGSYVYDASAYRVRSIEELGITFRRPVEADIIEANNGTYVPSEVKQPFFFELAADLGWKFYFDSRNIVSLALYGRYALNKCSVNNDHFEVIDVSNSVSSARAPIEAGLVKSFHYYNFGLSVTYHWGFGKPIRESADKATRR